MVSILESQLKSIIGNAMAFLFLDATLTRDVEGTVTDPADPPTPTQATYTCKAIEEEYSAGLLAGGQVSSNDIQVLILASTLAVDPIPGDRITIRGVTRQIVPTGTTGLSGVRSDPARATWLCRCS
jgi:hypothetical protein